jgi:mannose/fructose/N-acetylgalactosamine-specific phosphotransferase system component IID
MYIVAVAWVYVVLMMAVAEATNSNGTVLGAIVTFVLYGVLPLSILIYIMRSPARLRSAKAKESAEAMLLTDEAQIDPASQENSPPKGP